MEPHAPYEPLEPFRSRFMRRPEGAADADTDNQRLVSGRWHELTRADVDLLASLYDAEVANVDSELQQLFAELERRAFFDNAIIILAADHGEEFWEQGTLTHGTNLYNVTVHVPLILIAPGFAGGLRVEEPVSLVDVAPTLLDLLDLPREPRFEGRSLVPLLQPQSLSARLRAAWRGRNASPPSGEALLQLESTGYGFDAREHTEGLVRGSLKLLVRPGGIAELYDLAHDPEEKVENPPELQTQLSTMTEALASLRSDLSARASAQAQTAPLDDATREKLRALGYHF